MPQESRQHAVPGADRVAALVDAGLRTVPDFPTPGVLFRDMTPLLADPAAFAAVLAALADVARSAGAEAVAGVEARGFMLAAPVAERTGLPFWPVRKAGKLPGPVLRREYALEYGTAALELRGDLVRPGQRVLVLDDVLATGGTARAACELVEEAGARVVALAVLLELTALGGRARLGERDVLALSTT
ncbi:adenine phosphoribosyltransferase [Paenibacillus sp. TRM 82003]|uniref:adenine phosphoribosyltransferase n=1 Tax=Kineococcus sp. TRM81007 TaxID=2925831 RepID=UPI001F5861BB|nr:adenine phosphoribosyltransferase [Kineococcus sp. TRM81007]MCI2238988.1 adenine phosphoribosyltransferase [Kineococcus sp. TRM81007]MCI3924408.1 adenine phosphoribosyltransferase [Paenibacillus sp. TRM 82003]